MFLILGAFTYYQVFNINNSVPVSLWWSLVVFDGLCWSLMVFGRLWCWAKNSVKELTRDKMLITEFWTA